MKPESYLMNIAIEEAEKAYRLDEVPVGAVIVDSDGKIVSKAHNDKEKTNNPCGHAEILAIQKASSEISNWRLSGYHLYVTLEPCLMCMGAIMSARLDSLTFGAYDKKGGSLSLGYRIPFDTKLNHRFSVAGGVEHFRCSKMLSDFFKEKRNKYNFKK
tara:strand:+ start:160806 stop:161279 length:474 start_codon:yes stop_codon:yes gene_type:complete